MTGEMSSGLDQHNAFTSRYFLLYQKRKKWAGPVYIRVEKASKAATKAMAQKEHNPAVFVGGAHLPAHLEVRKPGKRQNLSMLVRHMHEKLDI